MEIEYREVMFCNYCIRCKHFEREDYELPCSECLEEPINLYTDKPVRFEEK
jgi:hypothetical protein